MTSATTVVTEPGAGLCSIIMPSFRMGRFIGAALDSLAAQTYRDWELIVVDDCGPDDGTRDAVQAFAANHPDRRVEFIRHPKNRGVSMARRTAFEAVRGEFVAFLDPDDVYRPDKLRRHVGMLVENPRVVLVHGAIAAIDADEQIGQAMESSFRLGPTARTYDLRAEPWCFRANRINNSTVVCRRTALRSQDFPEQLCFQTEDWCVWLLVASRGLFRYDPEPLTEYRCHADSFSSRNFFRPGALPLAYLEILASVYATAADEQKPGIAASMIDQVHMLVAQRAASQGIDDGQGTRHLLQLLRSDLRMRCGGLGSLPGRILRRLMRFGARVQRGAPGNDAAR